LPADVGLGYRNMNFRASPANMMHKRVSGGRPAVTFVHSQQQQQQQQQPFTVSKGVKDFV